MTAELETLKEETLRAIEDAADAAAPDQGRVSGVGKKGRITGMMKELGGLDPDARRERGQALNALRDAIATAIDARKAALEDAALDARLAGESLDVSLPARPEEMGRIHPISQTIEEVAQIFGEMGFVIAEGPDIETDWHNFTALNIPPEHPARQMFDTFYLPEKPDGSRMVLRTCRR